MDLFAHEIGMDPAEVRRKNLVASDKLPQQTPTGATYDTGDYVGRLDKALPAAGKGDGDRLGLDRGRGLVAAFSDGLEDVRSELEVMEGHEESLRVHGRCRRCEPSEKKTSPAAFRSIGQNIINR